MLFTASPDSTQTDSEKQDIIEAKKSLKNEPCELEELIKNHGNPFEFCKPNGPAFSAYRDKPRDVNSALNSPCKPRLTVDTNRATRLGTCRSVKRSRDYDSPVSTLEDVCIVFWWKQQGFSVLRGSVNLIQNDEACMKLRLIYSFKNPTVLCQSVNRGFI